MNLTFFKNESQPFFNRIRKFASVDIVSRKSGEWYINERKTKAVPTGVIRWRTELNYPSPTINSRESVILANNKREQRRLLMGKVSTPKSWFDRDVEFPCLARPTRHSRGSNFYILKDKKDLDALPIRNWYFSEWIEKEKEYRVYVGGGTCLGGFDKPIEGCVRGNIAETGSWGELIQPPKEVSKLAIKATEILGLDFCGVDIISDGADYYLLKINSGPFFVSDEVAEMFYKYFTNE